MALMVKIEEDLKPTTFEHTWKKLRLTFSKSILIYLAELCNF